MKARLDLIEARLQSIIEGSISRLLPRANLRQMLAHQLVESMRIHLVSGPNGQIIAPDQYTICINLSQGKLWLADEASMEELTKTLEQAARDAGFLFSSKPIIRLNTDCNLALDDLRVEVFSTEPAIQATSYLSLNPYNQPGKLPEESLDNRFLHAFLIINSSFNYHLTDPVINIGRRKDNNIVIEDLRVSRAHAQLRSIKGRYVLFDLNSKGGTFVNDLRISQCLLNPGDVISLAGVPLIYGQDTAPNLSHTTNMPISPDSKPGSG